MAATVKRFESPSKATSVIDVEDGGPFTFTDGRTAPIGTIDVLQELASGEVLAVWAVPRFDSVFTPREVISAAVLYGAKAGDKGLPLADVPQHIVQIVTDALDLTAAEITGVADAG